MFVRNHNWSLQLQKLDRFMAFYLSSQWQSQLGWCCNDGWIYMDDWQVWCYIFFPLQLYLILLFLSGFFFSMSKTLEPFSETMHFKDWQSRHKGKFLAHGFLTLPGNTFRHEMTLCAGFIFYIFHVYIYRTFLSHLQTVDNKDNKKAREPSGIEFKNSLIGQLEKRNSKKNWKDKIMWRQ